MTRCRNTTDIFWSRFAINPTTPLDDCWIWQSTYTKQRGYGLFSWRGKYRSVHRFAYELVYGPVPNGLLVCHRCDVKLCGNPLHLYAGTDQDNARDRQEAGRYRLGEALHSSKLRRVQVATIKARLLQPGVNQCELAREFGVDQSTIQDILKGRTWAHVSPA